MFPELQFGSLVYEKVLVGISLSIAPSKIFLVLYPTCLRVLLSNRFTP